MIEVIGKHRQAYRLKLEPEYKFHDVFHVSLLEPWHGRAETVAKLPSIEIDGHEEWEVKAILSHKDTKRGHKYLVRWKGYSPAEDTWEPSENLSNAAELLQDYLATASNNSHSHSKKEGKGSKSKLNS